MRIVTDSPEALTERRKGSHNPGAIKDPHGPMSDNDLQSLPPRGPNAGNPATLEARIAVLEARISPQPRTLIGHLKEWGGVATLVVALLYTFPLGVWDRFHLTPQAQRAAEVAALRDAVLELAELDISFGATASEIEDPEIRNFYSRAVGAKKFTLLTRMSPRVMAHADGLDAPELTLLAASYAQAGNQPVADLLYEEALAKSEAAGNVPMIADIYRLKAMAQIGSFAGTDRTLVRDYFGAAITALAGVNSDYANMQVSNTAFEWAQFEMAKGDWACGVALGHWAQERIDLVPPLSPEVASYQQQYRWKLASYKQAEGQTSEGCGPEMDAILK